MQRDEILLIVIGVVILLALRYKSIRFKRKRAKGDYKELEATVVDFEFKDVWDFDGDSVTRYCRKVYEYLEDGEYKIYVGETMHRGSFIDDFFCSRAKGKKAYLYQDIETGRIREDPNRKNILGMNGVLLAVLYLLFALFCAVLVILFFVFHVLEG